MIADWLSVFLLLHFCNSVSANNLNFANQMALAFVFLGSLVRWLWNAGTREQNRESIGNILKLKMIALFIIC